MGIKLTQRARPQAQGATTISTRPSPSNVATTQSPGWQDFVLHLDAESKDVWPASTGQVADCPRLAEVRGCLRRDLALGGASREPAGPKPALPCFQQSVARLPGCDEVALGQGEATPVEMIGQPR